MFCVFDKDSFRGDNRNSYCHESDNDKNCKWWTGYNWRGRSLGNPFCYKSDRNDLYKGDVEHHHDQTPFRIRHTNRTCSRKLGRKHNHRNGCQTWWVWFAWGQAVPWRWERKSWCVTSPAIDKWAVNIAKISAILLSHRVPNVRQQVRAVRLPFLLEFSFLVLCSDNRDKHHWSRLCWHGLSWSQWHVHSRDCHSFW